MSPDWEALGSARPEWRPWLAVVASIEPELADEGWDARVRRDCVACSGAKPARCRLQAFRCELRDGAPQALFARLARTARLAGLRHASVESDPGAAIETAALLQRTLFLDATVRDGTPDAGGPETALLHALADLATRPWLHAFRRVHAGAGFVSAPDGSCPCCGAWPTLAEVLGVDRRRRSCCARCGCAWTSMPLVCVYCGNRAHESLATLVGEDEARAQSVDVCLQCRGYLKVVQRISPMPPQQFLLQDYASVELDVAALDQGYRRPAHVVLSPECDAA